MTEDVEGLVTSISLNQVLVAILEEYGKLTVPTLKFLEGQKTDKELVIDYDDKDFLFTFSLRATNKDSDQDELPLWTPHFNAIIRR